LGWSGGLLGVTVGGGLGVPGVLGGWPGSVGSVDGGAGGVLVAGGIEGLLRSATPGVGVGGSGSSEAAADGRPSAGPLVDGGWPGWPFSSSGPVESGGDDGVGVTA
jgi:hypothetical protein